MTGTGTPAARASAMRRASVRIRDRRSPSSSSVNRYDFGTRTLSTAGRPRNSVRQSSASAPRLISTSARCGPATKTFHRRPPIGGGDESTGRLEESRGLGGRPFAPSGCEIWWEAPRVSRFQDAPFEQHDGGPVPLAPDGPAGGLKEPVDGGIDDRIIVALREPELPGVVISEGLPFHAWRTQRKADHDDGCEQVVMIINAFAEGPALDSEEEGAALRPGEPQGFEGPVPLGLAPVRALYEDQLRDAGGPEATVRLAEQLVRGEERRDVRSEERRDAANLPRDRVVHLLAPFHEKGRDVGRDEEQPVFPRERRCVRPEHSAVGCDPEEVRVHFRGEEGPGHQDARGDAVEHGPAEDARVQQPEGELPVRPWNDEPQDALLLIPPSHEEFRDLGKVRRDTAPDRVLPRERQVLHERRVAAGLAPLPAEARLDDIQEFVLAGDPLRAQRGEESLHGFGDPDEFVGHLPVDRPCLLWGLQQVPDREVADQMGADPVREVVRLVDDEDEILEGTSEPREESLAELAEHVVVVADDQPRFRRRVHGDPMRAHAARAARPDELLHVQGPLEDRGHDGGIVPGKEPARPRLHLEVAEFLEGPTVGRRALLEAHGMLRD